VTGDNAASSATTDQGGSNISIQNGNNVNDNDDTAATTTTPTNYDHSVDNEHHLNVDPTAFPLGVRLTTV